MKLMVFNRHNVGLLLLPILASAMLFLFTRPCLAQQEFGVTHTRLGDSSQEIAAGAANGFVESLNARKGFTASFIDRSGTAGGWKNRPARLDHNSWISLVTVVIGERRDWIALQWDDKCESVLAAVRRPARPPKDGIRRDWYAPGTNQISPNAVKELAADWDRKLVEDRRMLLQVLIKPWDGADAELLLEGDLLSSDTPVSKPINITEREAATALAMTAAYEVGWAPTTTDIQDKLVFEISREPNSFSVRATFGDQKHIMRQIPTDALYDHLLVLARKVTHWKNALSPLRQLRQDPIRLLAEREGVAFARLRNGLLAFDVTTGQKKWQLDIAPRSKMDYIALSTPDGQWQLFEKGAKLVAIDRDTGARKVAGGVSVDMNRSVLAADGTVVSIVEENKVVAADFKRERWTFTSDTPLRVGPTVHDNQVFVGDLLGKLTSLDLTTGKVMWHAQLEGPLTGQLFSAGGYVFAGNQSGRLMSVGIKSGSFLWQIESDVLLNQPVVVGDHLLLVDRSNVIRLVQPGDGKIVRQVKRMHWLLDAKVVAAGSEKRLVCLTQSGNVVSYDPATLKQIEVVHLGERPTGPMFISHAGRNGETKVHQLLFGDNRGFVYAFPVR